MPVDKSRDVGQRLVGDRWKQIGGDGGQIESDGRRRVEGIGKVKDQLIKIQVWHIPVWKKDKDGKVQEPWMMRDVVNVQDAIKMEN